ncbi:Serine/threonine protein kinase PpkA [Sandaracinus amylolyticus]|uniref:Serine/threonine protein kinase PpkA n=2 Tax=Sandaracinus amylolyticus TaxID=927083 RepID=A0A0F6W7Y9_9BACT|nr:Serine/threonine protein kinase PpkA [Sandaracinus amylolyticus]
MIAMGGDDREGGMFDDPTFLARYAPTGTLGAGSSAEVQLCRDGRIGRDVAVKVLRADQSEDRDARTRFLREARLQGRLEHPGVVPVYELADAERARPWFTMKRVRGITLEGVIARLVARDAETCARFTRARLLAAFVQCCRTIDFAHAQNVVHRDLSPRNVMLGEFGEVHVLDWGLARLSDPGERTRANEEDDLSETRPGQALGTPGYMSPEQALGDPDVGPEADVYALGVILFEILATRPFNPGSTTRERLDLTIRGIEPSAALAGGEHDVPPELARVIASATRAHPGERTRTARELADAVERFLDGDRDLAERTRMADALVIDAKSALAREDGAIATSLLARAVALVPKHVEASTLLSRLLLEPPREVPPAVHERMSRWAEGAWRAAARTATLRYLFWCSFIPVWIVMGFRDPPAAIFAIGTLVAMTAAMGLVAAGAMRGMLGAVVSFLAGTISIAVFTQVFSPVLVAPTLMATHLIVYCAYAAPVQRAMLIAVALAGMGIPIVLEELGVLAPTFVVDAQGIHVLPRLVDFEPRLTWWLLVMGATTAVGVPGVIAGRVRDALVGSQRKLLLHTWHLEALLPRDER